MPNQPSARLCRRAALRGLTYSFSKHRGIELLGTCPSNVYQRPKTQLANPAIIKIAPPRDMVFANGGNHNIPPPEARVF